MALRAAVAAWRLSGQRVALVPTMGALHAGHVSLVEAARGAVDRVVATIFVNPKQFAPGEDFAAYPRDLAADHAQIAAAGADLVYAPELSSVYPAGFCTSISLGGPALAGLEDRFRPDHFTGVATVVTKLLLQAAPDIALFGEKDWQQLRVIERTGGRSRLAGRGARPADGARGGRPRDVRRAMPTSMPTNACRAPDLYRALAACAAAIAGGEPRESALVAAHADIAAAGFAIDYIELRAKDTLAPLADGAAAARLLVAARIGRTRLIDNVGVAVPPALPEGRNETGSLRGRGEI